MHGLPPVAQLLERHTWKEVKSNLFHLYALLIICLPEAT
jgi:hypothetical protein